MVEDGDDEQYLKELKEEICNDIAICHPEMVTRINEICKHQHRLNGRKRASM
jgi:hypothetical protein